MVSSGPENRTISIGDTNVTLTCALSIAAIPRINIFWDQHLNGELLTEVFATNNPNP